MPKRTLLIILLVIILTGGIATASLYVRKRLSQPQKELSASPSIEPEEIAPEITPTEPSEIDTSKWKTYKNEKIKVKMKYPSDWEIQEEPLDVDFLKKYSKDSNKLNCTFKISTVLPEFLDQTLQLHKYMKAGSWRKEEIILNGIPTTKISYPEFPIAGRYFLKRGERVYYLILYDATETTLDEKGHEVVIGEHVFDPECMRIFNQMLSTFEIIK